MCSLSVCDFPVASVARNAGAASPGVKAWPMGAKVIEINATNAKVHAGKTRFIVHLQVELQWRWRNAALRNKPRSLAKVKRQKNARPIGPGGALGMTTNVVNQ